MAYPKGKPRPAGSGRRPGTPNKLNAEFRETVRTLLEDNSANVARWLALVAEGDGTERHKPDPARALELLAKLAEFAAPKLSRSEVTGVDGAPQTRSIAIRFIKPGDPIDHLNGNA